MNEATEETTMPPMFAKERAARDRDSAMRDIYDRLACLRDMVALARVATTAVAQDGDERAVAGLAWAMHLAQEEADGALADLRATMPAPHI